MIAVVEQALGHIHRRHPCTLILQTIEHKLMTACRVYGQFIYILERLLDIVGIERSQRTHVLHLITTQREDISVGPQHHSEVALIGRHEGEMLLQPLSYAHGAGTRTATAMRGGESLMEIDVHHVEAHIAWATGTKHRIEVGTIIIHQATTGVDEFCNLRNMFLEESEGIRIGHHHGGDIGAFLIDQSFQVNQINESLRVRLHLEDLETTYSG